MPVISNLGLNRLLFLSPLICQVRRLPTQLQIPIVTAVVSRLTLFQGYFYRHVQSPLGGGDNRFSFHGRETSAVLRVIKRDIKTQCRFLRLTVFRFATFSHILFYFFFFFLFIFLRDCKHLGFNDDGTPQAFSYRSRIKAGVKRTFAEKLNNRAYLCNANGGMGRRQL